MEIHWRFCYKEGKKPKYKACPKHPVKVHVWAGISCKGATGVCVFDGIMDTPMYMRILECYLIPLQEFIQEFRFGGGDSTPRGVWGHVPPGKCQIMSILNGFWGGMLLGGISQVFPPPV